MGLTIVDSLDTLLLMGLEKEFGRALDWIEQNLHFRDQARALVAVLSLSSFPVYCNPHGWVAWTLFFCFFSLTGRH
jgi:hypothetical protein